jgi:hypothetical protein
MPHNRQANGYLVHGQRFNSTFRWRIDLLQKQERPVAKSAGSPLPDNPQESAALTTSKVGEWLSFRLGPKAAVCHRLSLPAENRKNFQEYFFSPN